MLMLEITKIILSVTTIVLAAYGLITQNFEVQPLMSLSLGLLMLVMGLIEFKKERKTYGWIYIFTFLFSIITLIQTLSL